jgi:hypothetical protein
LSVAVEPETAYTSMHETGPAEGIVNERVSVSSFSLTMIVAIVES